MSIKKLAIRSVFSNWTGRVCGLGITFFLTPFIVHTLGNESYGIWAILMSFTNYYALADLGVRAAATKYISQYVGIQDQESTSKIIITTLFVYLAIAVCFSLVVLSIAWLFPFVIELSQEKTSTVRYVILLSGGAVAIQLLGQVFSAMLHSRQRFDLTNVVAVSSQLITALGYVIALRAGFGLMGMAAVTLVSSMLARTSLAVLAIRIFKDLSFSFYNFDRNMLKLVFKFARTSFLTNTARRLTQYVGTLIIGLIYGPAAVTFYAIPESLSRQLESIAKGITSVIDPLASRLNAQGKKDSLIMLLILAPRFLLAYALSVAVLLFTHGEGFISFWIGPEYATESYPILCVLALALVGRLASSPLRSLLRGVGQLRVLVIAAVLEMMIVLIAGPIFAFQFGLAGMAWAILSSKILIGAIFLPVNCCRVFDFPFSKFVHSVVWKPICVAIATLTVAVVLAVFYPSTSFFIHLIQMMSIALCAAMATFLLCLDRSQKLDILAAISQKIPGKIVVESNRD